MFGTILILPTITFEGFQLGPVYLHFWGSMVAVGIIIAIYLALAKKRFWSEKYPTSTLSSLSEDQFWNFSLILVFFIFFGARVSYVLEEWPIYKENIFDIFKIWRGGFSLFGGVVFGLFYAIWWSKKHKINLKTLGAIFAPAWLFGLFFGRIGCSFIHDHLGKPTDLPWAMFLKGAYRHEPALYEAIFVLLLGLFIYYREKNKPNKNIFLFSLIAYAFGRFWLDFLRAEPTAGGDERFFALTLAQWIAIGIFMTGLFLLPKTQPKKLKKQK